MATKTKKRTAKQGTTEGTAIDSHLAEVIVRVQQVAPPLCSLILATRLLVERELTDGLPQTSRDPLAEVLRSVMEGLPALQRLIRAHHTLLEHKPQLDMSKVLFPRSRTQGGGSFTLRRPRWARA